jgi:hypothetical protein
MTSHTLRRVLPLFLSLALLAGSAGLFPLSAAQAAREEPPVRGRLTCTEIISPQYEDAQAFSEELAAVQKDGKWGYLDPQGQVVIDFQFDIANPFSEGRAIVGHQDGDILTLGLIDHSGQYTPFTGPGGAGLYSIPLAQFDLTPHRLFYNGCTLLPTQGGGWALYRTDGTPLATPAGFVPTYTLTEGRVAGYTPGRQAPASYLNAQGQTALALTRVEAFGDPIQTEWGPLRSHRWVVEVYPYNQGLAPACQQTSQATAQLAGYQTSYAYGFLDRSGNWAIQPQYDNFFVRNAASSYEVFGETGLAMVQKGELWGAVDKSGRVVIPFQYQELWPYTEGLALFKSGGYYGYLDENAQVVIPARYQLATGFSNGCAVVYDGSRVSLIDRTGAGISSVGLDPETYFGAAGEEDTLSYLPDTYVVLRQGERFGYGKISYLPPLPTAGEMSGWAQAEVISAIEEELVPVPLQNLYRNQITREEFCTLAMEAATQMLDTTIQALVLERTGKDLYAWMGDYPFTDVSNSAVTAAWALGIVTGRGDGIFDPYASITREEAAAFLTRTAALLGLDTGAAPPSGFADRGQVGSWFTEAVDFVAQAGIMGGTGQNRFTPQGTYTREQSYLTVHRLLTYFTTQME